MPSVSYRDIWALETSVHLSVPDKLPLPWHQEFMTALSQASSPCLSYGAGALMSSPAFAFICSFFSLPWSWCILCCVVCCAGDSTRAWHCLLCSEPVELCPIGQGMSGSPSSVSLCPWPRMKKWKLCGRTDKCKGFNWTEKYPGISFFLSFFFQLTVFFDCQCCLHIEKIPKTTSFL